MMLPMTKTKAILLVLVLFVVSIMLVGSLSTFIPLHIQVWLDYTIISAAVLWFLWSWFNWYTKQRGDQNELDCLEEVVQEHERGIRDNSKTIREQIFFIERDHKKTPVVQNLLERARRALEM